jgi:hypothetical protein
MVDNELFADDMLDERGKLAHYRRILPELRSDGYLSQWYATGGIGSQKDPCHHGPVSTKKVGPRQSLHSHPGQSVD